MADDPYTEALRYHRAAAKEAHRKSGQEASDKPDRHSLEFEFGSLNVLHAGWNDHIRTCIINFAYTPSTSTLSSLKSISLSELRLETHHRGKVLIIRTFGNARRLVGNVGVQSAVEDSNGNVDRLSVYNIELEPRVEHILPTHCVFAVKEPYYKAAPDGGYTVQVDHPSDLLRLPTDHSHVLSQFGPQSTDLENSSPQSWKMSGNAAYGSKDYLGAFDKYTQGIDACGEKYMLLRSDLYRNRSITSLLLKRYQGAVEDAESSITCDPRQSGDKDRNSCSSKASFRAGRANFELRCYEKAAQSFEDALRLAPGDTDIIREKDRVAARIHESKTGSYNFCNLTDKAIRKKPRLDLASFTQNVTIGNAGVRGRGLFATTDLNAGDLIMCEKAFEACFRPEVGAETYMTFDGDIDREITGSHAMVLFRVVDTCHQRSIHVFCKADLLYLVR